MRLSLQRGDAICRGQAWHVFRVVNVTTLLRPTLPKGSLADRSDLVRPASRRAGCGLNVSLRPGMELDASSNDLLRADGDALRSHSSPRVGKADPVHAC